MLSILRNHKHITNNQPQGWFVVVPFVDATARDFGMDIQPVGTKRDNSIHRRC